MLSLLGVVTGFIALASDEVIWDIAFNSVLFLSGIFGLFVLSKSVGVSISSSSWPKVKFDVEHAQVKLETGIGQSQHPSYMPYFIIRYNYEDKVFSRGYMENLNLGYTKKFGTLEKANKYMEEVRNGLYGHYVYVNPDDPNVAFLRTGISREQINMIVFCILIIFLPAFYFISKTTLMTKMMGLN